MAFRFDSVPAVRTSLADVNYLSDEGIAGVVYLADRLQKAILVEAPACGRTPVPAVPPPLADVNYLSDEGIAGVVYLADRLQKPILVEGPAGTGKTQLAKSVAEITGVRPLRLQGQGGPGGPKA